MRRLLVTLAVFTLVLATTPARALAAQPTPVSFHRFLTGASLTIGTPTATGTYADPYGTSHDYEAGTWTGDWFRTGFGFTELVASWNAETPSGTWIEVGMQALTDKGTPTKWYVMGRWTYLDDVIHRTSVGHQGDDDGYIAIDTFFAKDHPMVAYRLRVTLFRLAGTSATPTVRELGAVASNAPNEKPYIPSPLGGAEGLELTTPLYSQMIHTGQYPEFDGGGEAWCSPTASEMVVESWGKAPGRSDLSWVDKTYADPSVDYAARYTYDYHYGGTGNWPFNAAYAGHYGLTAFVTQLRSLTEAERFIKAGIPLVASIAANPNKLTGFMFDKGTNGHLTTIVGFDADGNVISNDPASPDDASVRHVYDRAEFENAWLTATGGIVYVIYDPSQATLPAPATPSQPNW